MARELCSYSVGDGTTGMVLKAPRTNSFITTFISLLSILWRNANTKNREPQFFNSTVAQWGKVTLNADLVNRQTLHPGLSSCCFIAPNLSVTEVMSAHWCGDEGLSSRWMF